MVKDKIAEIRNFFDPVQLKDFEDSSFLNNETALGNSILINSAIQPIPVNSRFELAIICVDGYLTKSNTKQNTAQQIREELYKLKKIGSGLRIADFGNLKKGANLKETIYALQEVCSMFFYLKIKVVIIGGAQLLTIGVFRALKEFENNINLVHIDSKIDISSSIESAEETDYLSKIIEQDASHIYNISAVGYQSYYVDSKQINKINESFFDHYRLGEIRSNFENIEPVLRDADLVSFDISAIRMSEAPGQSDGSPNGFYADEACRLSRYAGISDRNQAFGLFEIETKKDKNRQTVKLSAQILWYYFDGYFNRKHDFPHTSLSECTKYEVQIDEIDFPIVFYRSDKSGRWWIEIETVQNQNIESECIVVSCTKDDYLNACKNEIPERWWLNFKKLKTND